MPKATKEKPMSPTERAAELMSQMEIKEAQERTAQRQEQAEAQVLAETKEADRLARIEAIRQRAKAELSGEDLEAARVKLQTALDEFAAVNFAYEQRMSEITEPLFNDSSLTPLPTGWGNAGFNLTRPQIDGQPVPRARPQTDIAQAAKQALRKHYGARYLIDFETPHE